MRLFNFLNEGRSQIIDKEKTILLLKEHCQQAIKNNVEIYRDVYGDISDFMFIDPSKFNRESANTSNYYTILMDNLQSWKKYPKRSKSVICSINTTRKYRVFPYDNAKIGICPTIDLWFSFRDYFNSFSDFNDGLDNICDQLNIKQNLKNTKTIEELYSIFEIIDKNKTMYLLNLLNERFSYFKHFNFWQRYFKIKIPLKKFIDKAINPEKNDFELAKINNFPNVSGEREVWTDSPCIMIKNSEVNEILKEL